MSHSILQPLPLSTEIYYDFVASHEKTGYCQGKLYAK
jgi:hypothetical protein